MGEDRRESADELRQHWDAMRSLGQAVPGTGLAALGQALEASGPWPEDLRHTPMILDTDIGGDADDAVAVAAAARQVPELTLLITSDEVRGQRARFARHLLDLTGRSDVRVVAGASLGESRYFCVDGLTPSTVPDQPTDLVAAVREVCAATDGPVRWVGMAPLTNLARVLAEAPDAASRLRVTQMGGALRYRDPSRAEHNIRLDVPSARHVLDAVARGALAAPEFVASEVTFTPRIEITPDTPIYRQLRDPQAPPWARLLAAHLDRWFAGFYPGTMQHDALTLTAALELPFVDSEQLSVEMDEIGRTTEAPPGHGTRVRWSRAAEYEPFMAWLNASLTDPAPERLSARGR
jgi:inosine-uridine nucleoside N-ribohydrolase